jgi:hypothetical protein
MSDPNQNGPVFGKAASYIGDVQLRHTLSPDGKQNTILFDNLTIQLSPGGLPIVTQTLSLSYPLVDIKAEMPLILTVRGHLTLMDGAFGSLVFRVLGQTFVLDPLLSSKADSANFEKTLQLMVRAGDELNMVLLMVLERDRAHASAEALLAVDALDMALQ